MRAADAVEDFVGLLAKPSLTKYTAKEPSHSGVDLDLRIT